jgi:DNA-binding CsgD family transcriptional regulator
LTEELHRALGALAAREGYPHYLCTVVARAGGSVLLSNLPDRWLDHHANHAASPVVRMIARSVAPFSWQELQGAEPSLDFWLRLRSAGLSDGVTAPVTGPAGAWTVGLSLVGAPAPHNGLRESLFHGMQSATASLYWPAVQLAERCLNLARLTPSQRKLLSLMARGETMDGIARAFSIRTRTVEDRLRKLLEDLGVENRAQAIVLATQMGYIDFTGEP